MQAIPKMTVAELQTCLHDEGLPVSGRKAELVHRLNIHLNPITHGVPRSPDQLQNPKTRAEAERKQKERDAHRIARGIPLGMPIGSLYDTGDVDDDGQPIMARIYAEDALPRLSVVKPVAVRELPPIVCMGCGSRDVCTCDDADTEAGEQE